MTRLSDTHPQVYKHMLEGGFSVQLGEHSNFGRIPVDQTIEETINKDTQTAGNVVVFISRFYIYIPLAKSAN